MDENLFLGLSQEARTRGPYSWSIATLSSNALDAFASAVATLETIRRNHSESRFMADEMVQAAAERNLQVAIQSVLDICNHDVADMNTGSPR